MIEFKGNIDGDCKRFLLKRHVKSTTICMLIVATFFAIPVILTAIFWKPIALLFLIPLFCLVIAATLTPNKKEQKMLLPKRLYIDMEEEAIVAEFEKTERFHMLYSVNKVLDYGEWYYFVFNYENRDESFICQKNLITQGTLEVFEKLFVDKLEKV